MSGDTGRVAPVPVVKPASSVPLRRSILRRVAAGWIVFRYEPGKQPDHPHPAYPMFWHGEDRWVGSSKPGEFPQGTLVFASADDAREAREDALEGLSSSTFDTTEQERLFV